MVVLVRGHSQGELWGLAHDPNTATFATVSDDSTLRIWNMDIQEMMYIKELPCGARVVSYSNNGKYVVVGLLNGKILFFNSETMESKGEVCNQLFLLFLVFILFHNCIFIITYVSFIYLIFVINCQCKIYSSSTVQPR